MASKNISRNCEVPFEEPYEFRGHVWGLGDAEIIFYQLEICTLTLFTVH